ncbi:hypothetical protein [Pseudobacteriovorax antillogorgiicola]|uniref:Uncharacterized protein n=1 Tax=Pseudobacteriovorax antillogorgiicola TaxID=1513793 RepID=A0A1Y6BB05_9BACT|nr:hypothetical protein [Pseudobacteriovorax antillogorgiicola]TCS57358.1 hypothetical protein EDD56_10398 [Pseudobacteriovorax antillogorgiicola]SMF02034.1 hypothetical protein SAMN06296036_103235 [Pseudobacteriovorax antillogorgiicola]
MTAVYIGMSYLTRIGRFFRKANEFQRALLHFLSVIILNMLQVEVSDFHSQKPRPGERNHEVIANLAKQAENRNRPSGRFMSMNCPYMTSGVA